MRAQYLGNVVHTIRGIVIKVLNHQGSGDLTDAQYHVEWKRDFDFEAVEALLGGGKFAPGEKPTSYDATVFAFLHAQRKLATQLPGAPALRFLAGSAVINAYLERVEALLFAGDGVQKRTALGSCKASFQSTGHGAVDAQRTICDFLHFFHQLAHQVRLNKVVVSVTRILGHFVRENRARVDVQHRCACSNLCQCIRLHAGEIARFQFRVQDFSARRVDTFTDHAEWFVETHDRSF